MTLTHHRSRRFAPLPLLAALIGAGLSIASHSAAAAEHAAAAPAAPPTTSPSPVPVPPPLRAREAAARDAPAAPAAEGTKAAAGKAPPLPDPMDRVRERLAEKLGATKAVETREPGVLRVVTRTAAPAPAELELRPRVASATRAPLHGVPASVQPAARLAAAHRAEATPSPASAHADGPAHWDYAGGAVGAGPDAWGQMKPEFAKCSSGTRQSPIDIRDGIKVSLEPVQFDYKPSAFRVVDNGHTIQVNVGPGNSIEVGGRRFELLQFHFHRPSEERINGRQFDMVAHLVHKDIDGRLAVVAVLLDRGSVHPLVQNVWNNLPLEKNDEVAARSSIDLNSLLPTDRSYFTYMGSLTTPPCSEGVLWLVMKTPMPISPEQVGIFARLYPMNARPIQAVAGRLIKESN
jgi:carbonic anhydrase